MNKPLTAIVVILSMGMTSSLFAQDFEKGRRAAGVGDYATAYKEWKWLAEGGLAIAQYTLGMMYQYGQYGGGFAKNYNESINWYRKAAEQGFAKAQTTLGYMYERGEGFLQDNVYSHVWFNLAASNGDELGAKFRDELAKKMTAVDLSKAQELARECVKKQFKGC